MFDKEFYPTPTHVLDTMLFNVDLKNKTVLEPQAGSGSIIDYCYSHGAKKVLCCEKNIDLAKITSSKGTFICFDSFDLKPEQIRVLPSETDAKQTGREKSKSKKMNLYV